MESLDRASRRKRAVGAGSKRHGPLADPRGLQSIPLNGIITADTMPDEIPPIPDFLKDLPEAPPSPPVQKNRFVLTMQFFIVPAIILGICIGLFLLIQFMTSDSQTLPDIFARMKTSHGHQKAVYAEMFVRRIRQERADPSKPLSDELRKILPEVIEYVRSLSGKELSTEQGYDKKLCINALGIIGEKDAASVISDILTVEQEETILWDCLNALGALRDRDSVPTIRKFLDHSAFQVRSHAVKALGDIGDSAAVPDLQARVRDAATEVQWNSAFVLAFYFKDKTGVPVLLQMLDPDYLDKAIPARDPNREYFRADAIALAARALGAVRETTAVPALKKLAADYPHDRVRMYCRQAVAEIEKGR